MAQNDKPRHAPDRNRRWAIIGVVAVGCVVAGATAVLWTTRSRTDTEGVREDARTQLAGAEPGQLRRPDDWPAPDRAVAVANATFLATDGVAIASTLDAAKALAGPDGSTPTGAVCRSTSASLDTIGSQDQFRYLAAGTPDSVLAELTNDAATALASTLAACTAGDGDVAAEAERLRAVLTFVDLRRTELETAAR